MNFEAILTEPTEKRKRLEEASGKRMRYLIKENAQLKEQVKDLNTLLALNRDALQCMTQSSGVPTKGKEQRYSTAGTNAQETHWTVLSRETRNDEQLSEPFGKSSLVNILIQENKKLAEKLDLVIEERNTAQNRAYLNERIIQQNIEFEEEIVKEYKEKIDSLKMNIRTKEYILHEFECLRLVPAEQQPEDKSFFIFKEVTAPYKLVNSITNEKKTVENELVEERVANSKIRKDYKTLFDKASVLLAHLVPRCRAQQAQNAPRGQAGHQSLYEGRRAGRLQSQHSPVQGAYPGQALRRRQQEWPARQRREECIVHSSEIRRTHEQSPRFEPARPLARRRLLDRERRGTREQQKAKRRGVAAADQTGERQQDLDEALHPAQGEGLEDEG